jgi:hypothetical protein
MQVLNTQETSAGRMMRAAVVLLALLAAASGRAVGADSCYVVNAKLTVPGEVFRQALLAQTVATLNAEKNPYGPTLKPVSPPPDPTRCTGGSAGIPQAGPAQGNYFGNVNSKRGFRNFVNQVCGVGARYEDQYFSMGRAIYYRNCHSGAGVNYIYFWGADNGKTSTCIGESYPLMYQAFLDASKNVVPTADDMARTYSGNGFAGEDPKAFALGNMMAAILIAESTRDYLVIPANYMLIDRLRNGKAGLSSAKIIGGHCIPSAGTCQNKDIKQDGAHPLAWGGALETMMLGVFAGPAGATTDFGMQFERDLIVGWLLEKNLVEKLTSDCPTKAFSSYAPGEKTALTNLFLPLFAQDK